MKIGFFYPSYKVGGAELLYCRLAKEINNRAGHRATIIDYDNGFLSKYCKENHIEHIAVDKSQLKKAKGLDVVIFPPNYVYRIREYVEFDEKTRLLLWSIHPQNIESTLPFFNYVKNKNSIIKPLLYNTLSFGELLKLSSNFKKISENDALCFMDGANHQAVSELLNADFNKSLLPVPISNDSSRHVGLNGNNKSTKLINTTWLGRVEGCKINSILTIYNSLLEYTRKSKESITFNIIGDGNDIDVVKGFCQSTKHINAIFHGTKTEKELEKLLLNTDVLFAMGTSALEGGRLGVRTLLLDAFNGFVPTEYKYKWLYETCDYNLGFVYNSEREIPKNGLLLEEVFSQKNQENIEQGKKCKHYTEDSHDISAVVDSLLIRASDTKLSFEDFNLKIQYGFIRRLYFKVKKIIC